MPKIHMGILIIVFGLIAFLRFYNLGFSEYIPDETTVLTAVKNQQIFSGDFLQSQRKGPVQFLAAGLVNLIGVSPTNELVYRLPFAVASIAGLYFAYLTILEISGKKSIAMFSVLFLGINGFLIAFGRIVQYQSFNILFSFAGLYFYTKALRPDLNNKSKLINTFAGLLYLFLSLASHWDVVFFLPIVLLTLSKFIINNSDRSLRVKYLLVHVMVLVLLVAPFVTVYLKTFLASSGHQSYFSGRLGYVSLDSQVITSKLNEFLFRNQLYQPLYFIEFITVFAAIGLIYFKKSWPVIVWLLISIFTFILFVKKPGTHIYNIYIPLTILAGYGFGLTTLLFRKYFIVIPTLVVTLSVGFFTYQSYLLFLDPSVEYPWNQETILQTKTRKYDQISLSNNIIGFPLNRHWEEINSVILEDISNLGGTPDQYSYITNEVKSISAFYMDIPYGSSNRMYAIGIKKPFSFEQDYSFPQFHGRKTIAKIEYKGSMLARIYRIEPK
jgi:hypothetical protein